MPAPTKVVLYRRHSAKTGCPTLDPRAPEFRLSRKAKRLYTGCTCPIWVTGRIGGQPIERQSCKTRDMEEARRVVSGLASGLIGGGRVHDAGTVVDRGPTLAECTRRYLETKEAEVKDSTRSLHRLVLGLLAEFAAKNGITYVRQLTPEICERFKLEGITAKQQSSRGTYTAKFRAFLRECERLGWITERVAERVRPVHHEHEQTQPFEDSEVEKLLRGVTGIDRLLFELMLSTGLRISDALQFDPARIERGSEMWIYKFKMTKRKRLAQQRAVWCEVFISEDLKTRIDAARGEWLSALPFKSHNGLKADYKRVYRLMQKLGGAFGITDARPHRFRDTFAVQRLLGGVSLDDLSRLLHHSSVAMTEQAYAAWIPARTRRLEGIVAASFKPRSVNPESNSGRDSK